MKYYVAYGSNLSLSQMHIRCPYAKVAGISSLEGWKLAFRLHATIEPCEGSSVPVLLWEITDKDEKNLDRYEGWPRYYRKELVMIPLNGETVPAMVYIMNGGAKSGPDDFYLDIIREGYERFGFDQRILDRAVASA